MVPLHDPALFFFLDLVKGCGFSILYSSYINFKFSPSFCRYHNCNGTTVVSNKEATLNCLILVQQLLQYEKI